jgi:glycosyltransferase involved in cell wall biosynthesis
MKRELKHIYFFVNYNKQSPSVRYRIVFLATFLQRNHNINHSFVYPSYRFDNILYFIYIFFEVLFFRKSNSVIVFHKIHTNRIYAPLLKMLLYFRPQNTIYDIDDADYLRFQPKNINYFLKKCQYVTVGSEELKKYSKQFNANIYLLSSPVIDHNCFKIQKNKTLTIGWIGFFNGHRENLYQYAFPAIRALDFKVKLVVLGVVKQKHFEEISAYFAENQMIEVSMPCPLDWLNEVSIYELIKNFDVGIAPLLDTEFNRAKSAFKLKQCLSCGIPVLASYVGENVNFIEEGYNGFFCNTKEEFMGKLTMFKNMDDKQYAKLSKNAQKSAKHFDMNYYANSFLKIFQ